MDQNNPDLEKHEQDSVAPKDEGSMSIGKERRSVRSGNHPSVSWLRADKIQLAIAISAGIYMVATVLMLVAMLDTVKIATESLALSRQSFEATQRAWLTMKAEPITLRGGGSTITKILIKNTGRTPATDIVFVRGAIVRSKPLPERSVQQLFTEASSQKEVLGNGVAGPGENLTGEIHLPRLSKSDIEYINTGKLQMYLIAAITYEDEFHKTRSSRYCVQYNPSNGEWVFCPNNNAVE